MVNTLVNDWFVHKGSQSVLFVRTVMVASIYKGDPCEWMTSSSPLIGQKRGGSHVHSSSFFVWFGDYGFSSFGFLIRFNTSDITNNTMKIGPPTIQRNGMRYIGDILYSNPS